MLNGTLAAIKSARAQKKLITNFKCFRKNTSERKTRSFLHKIETCERALASTIAAQIVVVLEKLAASELELAHDVADDVALERIVKLAGARRDRAAANLTVVSERLERHVVDVDPDVAPPVGRVDGRIVFVVVGYKTS